MRGIRVTQGEFITRAILAHGDKYDYSQSVYVGAGKTIKIICPEHGIFEQRANSHLSGLGCQKCANKGNNLAGPIIEQFFNYVQKTDSCWLWTGPTEIDGYGHFQNRNKRYRAHRFSYELHKERITKGLLVCHKCDNPPCVNPEHLFLGTYLDNHRDMISKGRKVCVFGEDHPAAKLSETQVRDIREKFARGCSKISLGRLYNVGSHSITKIIMRKTWKHVV